MPQDAIAIEVVFLEPLLAHSRPLKLLLAMVSKLQNGLRELATKFCPKGKKKKSKGTESEVDVSSPNLRVELPYTYFMA